MTDILNITGEPIFDDRIVKIEIYTYNPYANTLDIAMRYGYPYCSRICTRCCATIFSTSKEETVLDAEIKRYR